ncbi:hypothetical protein ACE939_02390 [Aquimarina sp. W85]|uniref:hypothetical protein n=1 Tax=Aquimarina rhodophyticola TaxID=3342246 RepID=UPI003671089A
MKGIVSILLLSCFILQVNAQNLHEDALTAASYAFAHAKKAHGANNVFHTQEYADKAIESFRKAEDLAAQCECSEANETAYQATVDLESALEQDTYERSRFYVKRAKELGSTLLEQLTKCSVDSKNAVAQNPVEAKEAAIAEASQEVEQKQQELEEKRRQLNLEQQKLEQQIAEQNKLKAAFEAKRAAELKQQTVIKAKAELALKKLEAALQELSIVLNEDATFQAQKDYLRSQSDLENETLDDTKNFYVDQAKELTRTAMKQFAGNAEN